MKLNLKLAWVFILLSHGVCLATDSPSPSPPPTPAPWPEQFHAVLFRNLSTGNLQLSDLWYDWPKGRNVYTFQKQLSGTLLHEIEWNNGTSFYYTHAYCQIVDFHVGILRPDFLHDAVYLGTRVVDGGFLCNLWEKEAFIWYYEDVVTKTPVRWDFYDGIQAHVMSFEVGEVFPDSVTQAPAHCFTDGESLHREKFMMLENPLPHKMLPTNEGW